MGRSRRYDPKFKREAVRLVLEEGRSVRDVGRSLGITAGVLKVWVTAQRTRNGAVLGNGALRFE